MTSHILGFPRIGAKRELKFALEKYWKNEISQNDLKAVGTALRKQHWQLQKEAGLDFVTVGDFSFYDHILDTSVLLGAIPERFDTADTNALDSYFRAARGRAPTGADALACDMTKWFDTNYHYIVPELHTAQTFGLNAESLFEQINEARALGHNVKPVIVGPITYLYLSKTVDGSDRLALLAKLLPVYQKLLRQLSELSIDWVQIDEPVLVLDLDASWLNAIKVAYKNLQEYTTKILLATYFGGVTHHIELIKTLAVDGLHVDGVRGSEDLQSIVEAWPHSRVLSVGVVDGRNVWKNHLSHSLSLLKEAKAKFAHKLWVSASCSLLHSPVDLQSELTLDAETKSWFAFATQKLHEVSIINAALRGDSASVAVELNACDQLFQSRQLSTRSTKTAVRDRVNQIVSSDFNRKSSYADRALVQRSALNLPLFPTTTIGSFPQTPEIRGLRSRLKKSQISEQEYESQIKAQIAEHVKWQEKLGLDVLVHGEAERNDMVEYFGEQLEGFAFTQNGWVQSYGSRCVKPPIICGDIYRAKPITVDWTLYAQSLTPKPMKGMLTGPITILCWSFNRTDISRKEQALQIALALRDEVRDLERAGIGVIQIDEPAIREGLPLRESEKAAYLKWAVEAFRLATTGVQDATQIHTHMCYSEFNEIIEAIAALDADVITIETSRSQMELLKAFEVYAYPNEIGPGVYDIHSPVVPTLEQVQNLIEKASSLIPKERLWVNPDCGLKTRAWTETQASLQVMVEAAKSLRKKYAGAAAA